MGANRYDPSSGMHEREPGRIPVPAPNDDAYEAAKEDPDLVEIGRPRHFMRRETWERYKLLFPRYDDVMRARDERRAALEAERQRADYERRAAARARRRDLTRKGTLQ